MKLRYLSWIPAALIMCLIFYFSSKNAVESDASSLQIANGIMNIYEQIDGEVINQSQKQDILLLIDHIVRKMAHATEYGLLSASIAFHLWACKMRRRKYFSFAVILSAIYATTDELHQMFVAGRSPQVTDVIIDTSGAFIGAAVFLLLVLCLDCYKLKKRSHQTN